MTRLTLLIAGAVAGGFLSAPIASAQQVQQVQQVQTRQHFIGTAVVDLNIRSGPGPEHPVIDAMRANQRATINGCIEGSLWCQIVFEGRPGWVYSQYMTTQVAGTTERVIVSERPASVSVPTVAYQSPATTTTTVTTARPTISGRLVTPPVTTMTTTGVAQPLNLTPPAQVRTYVTGNPVDPVYLDGEVVVGAGLPETVDLRPVPDYQYRYVYVNRQPVLVDPGTRRIVYVYR